MTFSYKKIWIITYPVLISLLIQDLIGITDTAFLGRVGEVELAASALASVYYLTIYMVGFGFSIGAEIIMARRNGEQKYKEIGKIFMQGTSVLLILATIMFFISRTFSQTLLEQLIKSERIRDAAVSYIDWRVFGFFFSFIAIMFRAFYMATTNTRILTSNALVMLFSNVILNYILIFGKFGFPKLGIAGSAIASSVAELISLIFFVIYTSKKLDYKKYGLFEFSGFSIKIIKQIFNVSGWIMIQYFISTGTWLFFFMSIEHLGERSLAISNMVRNTSTFVMLFVFSYAATGSALVSNLVGAGKQEKVMDLCGKITKMCALSMLPFFLFILFFPVQILNIYSDNRDLIESAIPSLYVMLAAFIFTVPANIIFSSISGIGDPKSALWVELIVLAIYILFIYIIAINLKLSIEICWFSDLVYSFFLLIFSFLYFKKANWKNKRI